MRTLLLTTLAVFAVCSLEAKEKPSYQKAELLQMESSPCGFAEKAGKTIAGEILGTDAQRKNTQEVRCQEYILKSDSVIYRIRPVDDKHPILLPVGESVEFRIHKDKLLLRVPEADDKEREYSVLSMTPTSGSADSRAAARSNSLQ